MSLHLKCGINNSNHTEGQREMNGFMLMDSCHVASRGLKYHYWFPFPPCLAPSSASLLSFSQPGFQALSSLSLSHLPSPVLPCLLTWALFKYVADFYGGLEPSGFLGGWQSPGPATGWKECVWVPAFCKQILWVMKKPPELRLRLLPCTSDP